MERKPRLLDHRGQPVDLTALKEDFVAPTLDRINSVWSDTIVTGLTPVGLAGVLKSASMGHPDRFMLIAEEMEERDAHYASVLGTRKRAITSVEPIVVAASKDAEDQRISEAVQEIVDDPDFVDDCVTDALDALGKGYSLVEIMWERNAREWHPTGYHWRNQRHFLLDRIDGRTLRMKDPLALDGVDLPPFKFVTHTPKLKSGLPVRGGLARLCSWAFLFKSYTLKDWMAFLEVFGMPLRVGRYGQGASQDNKRVLLKAVREISTDAAAIIPKDMDIEFIEAKGGQGNAVFGAMSEYLDKQVSKAVLGQTMSTDEGASLSQAQVHENVRNDIARADARQAAATINRDLIRPFIDLNFGSRDKYPMVVFPITEGEDITALTDAVAKLVPLGLAVSKKSMLEKLGLDEPDDEDELLAPAAAPAPIEDGKDEPPPDETELPDDDSETEATARELPVCPNCGERHALAEDQRGPIDALVDEAASEWEQDLAPIIRPIEELFKRAKTYDELADGLDDLIAKMDAGPLVDRIAKLAMKARGNGDLGEEA